MRRVWQTLFLVLAAAAITQAFWQYGHSPDRVATHFDFSGRPNGWMSRGGALGLQVTVVLFEVAVIQVIALLMPRTPAEFMNIPNREYWLAPERRRATFDWVVSLLLAIGCGTMLFWLWLFALIQQVNAGGAQMRLSPGLGSGVLLAGVVVAIVVTLRRFRRPPNGAN